MHTIRISSIVFIILFIVACNTSKKTSMNSTAPVPPSVPSTPVPAGSFLFAKPANGIYSPGNEELTALQTKYSQFKDVTLDKLREGHLLYTEGVCTKCHNAKNIYKHEDIEWVKIIDDMALRARMSQPEKDAVFKYVIAIKAAQPK